MLLSFFLTSWGASHHMFFIFSFTCDLVWVKEESGTTTEVFCLYNPPPPPQPRSTCHPEDTAHYSSCLIPVICLLLGVHVPVTARKKKTTLSFSNIVSSILYAPGSVRHRGCKHETNRLICMWLQELLYTARVGWPWIYTSMAGEGNDILTRFPFTCPTELWADADVSPNGKHMHLPWFNEKRTPQINFWKLWL